MRPNADRFECLRLLSAGCLRILQTGRTWRLDEAARRGRVVSCHVLCVALYTAVDCDVCDWEVRLLAQILPCRLPLGLVRKLELSCRVAYRECHTQGVDLQQWKTDRPWPACRLEGSP